jgi:hypothetical protein
MARATTGLAAASILFYDYLHLAAGTEKSGPQPPEADVRPAVSEFGGGLARIGPRPPLCGRPDWASRGAPDLGQRPELSPPCPLPGARRRGRPGWAELAAGQKEVSGARQAPVPAVPGQVSGGALHYQVPTAVWQQEWVVHCQSVGRGEAALKYLAPYIFRVALSNNRLVKLENEQVTFRYYDNKGKRRYCTLPVYEFTVGSGSCNTFCPRASRRFAITACSLRPNGKCSSGSGSGC